MKKAKQYLITLLCMLGILSIHAQENFEMYYLQGDYDRIIKETAPLEDSIDHLWFAVASDARGEILEAISVLEDGSKKYPNDTLQLLLLSDLYYKTGQYAKAKPLLYRFINDPERFSKLIRVLEFESDNRQAISLLKERLETDSLNVEYLSSLGDNYLELDWQLNAKDAFLKLIEINPADIVTLAKLANIHLKLREPEFAILYCNRAMDYDSTNRTIIKIRGIAEFRLGNYEAAKHDFTYLIEQGDSSLSTLKHLGISEYKSYYYQDAEDHLYLAYNTDETDHEICYFLGKVLVYNEEPAEGLTYLILADSLIQPNPAVRSAILAEQASAYTDLFENQLAMDSYQKAFEVNPRPEYLFFMASLYEHRFKDQRRALELYQVFLSSLPPQDKEFNPEAKNRQSVSLKRTAEQNVERLREELFFNGELGSDTVSN